MFRPLPQRPATSQLFGTGSDLTPLSRRLKHYATPNPRQIDREVAAQKAKVPNIGVLADRRRPFPVSRPTYKRPTKLSRILACSPRSAALPAQSFAWL